MNRFSDRIGVTQPPELAREDAPNELRVALWNAFEPALFDGSDAEWRPRIQEIYGFLHWRAQEVPYQYSHARDSLEKWFFGADWHEVYNLCEFAARMLAREAYSEERVFDTFNRTLQDEGSPYRFVKGLLTAITDPIEIDAVRAGLASGDRFAGAREHLTRALELLGQRPEPDLRNTVKEAISAVESTLKVLTGHKHADLAAALREFAKAHPIHGALFKGLDSLYGYTSSEHGLRHALLEENANVGFAEAKFMVVACSGFVSYLIARTAQ